MSKIVFAGDSVTATRPGVATVDTFAYKIGTAKGFTQIVNKGVPGSTSTQGLARFRDDVLNENPDAASLMYGINDNSGTGLVSPAVYKSNMRSMTQQAKDAGIRVTLKTPNLVTMGDYINRFPPYLEGLQDVAYAEGVPFVDAYREIIHYFFLVPRSTFDLLYLDNFHLSPAGHTFVANLVLRPYNAAACN